MTRPNPVLRPAFGGRSRYLDPNESHARIYGQWRHLASFKTLTPLQLCILVEILMGFNKHIGNEVRLTSSGIRKRFGVSHKTARTAIQRLEECGWIERIGLGPGPTGQAGGVYQLLCLDASGSRVRGPYMTWHGNESAN